MVYFYDVGAHGYDYQQNGLEWSVVSHINGTPEVYVLCEHFWFLFLDFCVSRFGDETVTIWCIKDYYKTIRYNLRL